MLNEKDKGTSCERRCLKCKPTVHVGYDCISDCQSGACTPTVSKTPQSITRPLLACHDHSDSGETLAVFYQSCGSFNNVLSGGKS